MSLFGKSEYEKRKERIKESLEEKEVENEEDEEEVELDEWQEKIVDFLKLYYRTFWIDFDKAENPEVVKFKNYKLSEDDIIFQPVYVLSDNNRIEKIIVYLDEEVGFVSGDI
jgi:hypothetical protein